MSRTGALKRTDADAVLMRRVATGDVRAFEAIYDRYHQRAYSLALRITGRSGGAEEATQDAFLSLWRGAADYDPARASLGAWLLTVVRYRSIDSLRRAALRAPQLDLTEGAAGRLEAPERTEEQVLADERTAWAHRLVARLPPDQREVIDLAYFSGLTQQEIAAKVGVPLGTVKGRARLGLDRLRQAAAREDRQAAAA